MQYALFMFWVCLLRQGKQSKNKQMEPCEAEKHLHSEGNYQQNENATYQVRENSFKLYI